MKLDKKEFLLDKSSDMPQHVAVIMDGNGRWAQKKGAERIFGHQNAVQAVRDVSEGCVELEIPFLTLYAFSTENWGRPKAEVDALMSLLVSTIKKEIHTLIENGIQLNAIGDIDSLPVDCQNELKEAIEATQHKDKLVLTLALSYSGRWDMLQAVKKLVKEGRLGNLHEEDITAEMFSKHLSTNEIPDPELLIRTSGEMRLSNFLLWQMAYTELYVTEVLWPDFRKEHLHDALIEYTKRDRRFGKVNDKIKL